MKITLLIKVFFVLIFFCACNKTQKIKGVKNHHHTSKVSGYISLNFKNRDQIQFNFSDRVDNIKIMVFHKEKDLKTLLFQTDEVLRTLNLTDLADDHSSGYLFVVASGTVNGQDVTNSANYKLNEQDKINFESEKLKVRSSNYEPE